MYPKILFAVSGGSVVVDDAAHERALGPGWLDNAPVYERDAHEGDELLADLAADAGDTPDADTPDVATKPSRKKAGK
jgi:hypothetical protein